MCDEFFRFSLIIRGKQLKNNKIVDIFILFSFQRERGIFHRMSSIWLFIFYFLFWFYSTGWLLITFQIIISFFGYVTIVNNEWTMPPLKLHSLNGLSKSVWNCKFYLSTQWSISFVVYFFFKKYLCVMFMYG